jgi:hypothetical protein
MPSTPLDPRTVSLMQDLVTKTRWSYAEIARRCSVSTGAVHKYAKARGWERPADPRAKSTGAPPALAPAPVAAADDGGPSQAMTAERRRAVIADLWRVAEMQTQYLAAAGRARPSELKLLVDVAGRLTQLEEQARKDEPPPPAAYEGPATFDDVNRIIAEITERFYAFGEEQAANGTWDDEDESETGDRAGDARRH